MFALGAKIRQMGAMDIDHIFLARLRLLIIMLKAYLKGYPIGQCRLEGIMRNARIVGDEAVYLWGLSKMAFGDISAKDIFDMDPEFYEHIKMLTLLTEKIESDKEPDRLMAETVNTHLDYLSRSLSSDRNLSEMQFLKVA